MSSTTSSSNRSPLWKRFLAPAGIVVLPLLTGLTIAARAGVASDPVGQSEVRYLALLVIAAMVAMASFGGVRRLGGLQVVLAVTLAAVPWLFYQGPRRGAVMVSVLVVGALVLAEGAWRTGRQETWWVPAAFLVQFFARGDLLLPPWLELHTLVGLVLLPTVVGLALQLLAKLHGARRAMVAGAAVGVLAPGWSLVTTATLVALAVGSWASLDPAVGGEGSERRWPWMLPFLALPFWQPITGSLIALAALILFLGRRWPWLSLGLLLVMAVTARVDQSPQFVLLAWVGGLALVPSVFLAASRDRWRLRQGALLVLVAAWVSPGIEALAVGIGVAALATPVRGVLAGLQGAWSGATLVGTLLLAAYPWCRATPLADAWGLLGLESGSAKVMLPLVLVVGLGTLVSGMTAGLEPTRQIRVGGGLALGGIALLLVWGAGPATVVLDDHGTVVLDAQRSRLARPVAVSAVSTVVVDTNLVRGAELAVGTEVARVVLLDNDGGEIQRWPLRVGRDTADWASGRTDIAQRPGFVAPASWVSQVSPQGDFFSQRFRRRLSLASPVHPAKLRIQRAESLPADVLLMVYHLELRP